MFICVCVCACVRRVQSDEGLSRGGVLAAAVLLLNSLFGVVFLLTLLLFSLGWGFIRQSLRSKEGWLVRNMAGGAGAGWVTPTRHLSETFLFIRTRGVCFGASAL